MNTGKNKRYLCGAAVWAYWPITGYTTMTGPVVTGGPELFDYKGFDRNAGLFLFVGRKGGHRIGYTHDMLMARALNFKPFCIVTDRVGEIDYGTPSA